MFFVVAWVQLAAFEPGTTALWLLSYWPRVLIYNLPFLAFALFASMLTASANLARIVALGGAVVLAALHGLSNLRWAREHPLAGSALDLLAYLSPFGHNDGLSYPPGGALPGDLLACAALTVLYFSAGFAVLARRDV